LPKKYTISNKIRPYVLSIAGFDPSAGAGVLADIKTFEELKVYGLSVITSNTIQDENEFFDLEWVNKDVILSSIKKLFDKYKIPFVKIGLVQSMNVLSEILEVIKGENPETKIIWDPVLSSSSGYKFNSAPNIESLLKHLYLITPNYKEINQLGFEGSEEEIANKIKDLGVNVFLKGGHNSKLKGRDVLFTKDKSYAYKSSEIVDIDKHGTGCVLSSAITAQLAIGYRLPKAGLKAKNYMDRFLHSNHLKLGYHKR
jgi:hydroxymethylpyrimidine/phosphomethylpyrimidine kinase